jgi:hypothetical protein
MAWDARPGPGGHEVSFDRTRRTNTLDRAIHVVEVILREKWRYPAGLSRWISFIGTRDAEKGRRSWRTSSQGGVTRETDSRGISMRRYHSTYQVGHGCQVQATYELPMCPFFSVPAYCAWKDGHRGLRVPTCRSRRYIRYLGRWIQVGTYLT